MEAIIKITRAIFIILFIKNYKKRKKNIL